MNARPFVLIHSPLLGPLTWQAVAGHLRAQGHDAYTPELADHPQSERPLWEQHVDSVEIPTRGAVLVGHSGAGALLPAIGERIGAAALVFVDAVLLFEPMTRLDLMRAEDADWADEFERFLRAGGTFPNWQEDDLRALIPDTALRQALLADMRPRSLAFFTERITPPPAWDTQPCAYIQLSETYALYAQQAAARGWPVTQRDAHHFAMLTHPAEIADLLIHVSAQLGR